MVLNDALAMQLAQHAAPAVAESMLDSIMDFAVIPYITLSIFCALLKMVHDHLKPPISRALIVSSYLVFFVNVLLIFSMHVGFIYPADNAISVIFHAAIIIIAFFLACILIVIMNFNSTVKYEKSDGDAEDLIKELKLP